MLDYGYAKLFYLSKSHVKYSTSLRVQEIFIRSNVYNYFIV